MNDHLMVISAYDASVVYTYKRNPLYDQWVLIEAAMLQQPIAEFGYSLSLNKDDFLAIGSPLQGAVYMYQWNATNRIHLCNNIFNFATLEASSQASPDP